jgi:hypothetical protein
MRIRDLRHRDSGGDRTERVEALGDRPGQALALRFVLDVARREVDGSEVVRYQRPKVTAGGGEVAVGAVGTDNEAELDFMVQGCAGGADDGTSVGDQDRGGRLEEEEGLRRTRGGELGYVVAGREGVSRGALIVG